MRAGRRSESRRAHTRPHAAAPQAAASPHGASLGHAARPHISCPAPEDIVRAAAPARCDVQARDSRDSRAMRYQRRRAAYHAASASAAAGARPPTALRGAIAAHRALLSLAHGRWWRRVRWASRLVARRTWGSASRHGTLAARSESGLGHAMEAGSGLPTVAARQHAASATARVERCPCAQARRLCAAPTRRVAAQPPHGILSTLDVDPDGSRHGSRLSEYSWPLVGRRRQAAERLLSSGGEHRRRRTGRRRTWAAAVQTVWAARVRGLEL